MYAYSCIYFVCLGFNLLFTGKCSPLFYFRPICLCCQKAYLRLGKFTISWNISIKSQLFLGKFKMWWNCLKVYQGEKQNGVKIALYTYIYVCFVCLQDYTFNKFKDYLFTGVLSWTRFLTFSNTTDFKSRLDFWAETIPHPAGKKVDKKQFCITEHKGCVRERERERK